MGSVGKSAAASGMLAVAVGAADGAEIEAGPAGAADSGRAGDAHAASKAATQGMHRESFFGMVL